MPCFSVLRSLTDIYSTPHQHQITPRFSRSPITLPRAQTQFPYPAIQTRGLCTRSNISNGRRALEKQAINDSVGNRFRNPVYVLDLNARVTFRIGGAYAVVWGLRKGFLGLASVLDGYVYEYKGFGRTEDAADSLSGDECAELD